MKTEESLAAAALVFSATSLVVAFIALIVALGQLLQAALGSVEGYRRCAESVIGPWEKLRHRIPNLREFRFEVEYATPHFMVLSSDVKEWESASNTFGYTYDLATLSGREQGEVEEHMQVLRSNTSPEDDTCIIAPKKSDANSSALRRRWFQGRKSILKDASTNKVVDPEKNAVVVSAKGEKLSLKPRRTEVLVSWLSLIEAVHRTYASYMMNQSPIDLHEPGRTNAAVAIRQWNWDFMPSDLIRPLATSTLNNLILFALRLDMIWRRLDLENGVFLADGNGYSLVSTEVRGLGIAFTFTSTSQHKSNRIIAPTEAVDKSIFGIIPGCKILVKKDIPYVSEKRLYMFSNIFEEIGVRDKEMRKVLATDIWVEQRYDAIILLSQFIPVPGCPLLFSFFPCFCTTPPTTPLHFFEGRVALMDALRERIIELSDQKHKAKSALKGVLDHFKHLLTKWRFDFLDKWDESVIETGDDRARLDLAKDCRRIFNYTTFYLSKDQESTEAEVEDGSPDWTESYGSQTRYVDLVAGHCIMAYHAVEATSKSIDQRRKTFHNTSTKLAEYHKEDVAWNDWDIAWHSQYFIGREYAVRLREGEHNIVGYLRGKGVEWHVDYIEAAWWVMILRGIVWDMSTVGDPSFQSYSTSPFRWRETTVPSSFYDLRTPVWIN